MHTCCAAPRSILRSCKLRLRQITSRMLLVQLVQICFKSCAIYSLSDATADHGRCNNPLAKPVRTLAAAAPVIGTRRHRTHKVARLNQLDICNAQAIDTDTASSPRLADQDITMCTEGPGQAWQMLPTTGYMVKLACPPELTHVLQPAFQLALQPVAHVFEFGRGSAVRNLVRHLILCRHLVWCKCRMKCQED